jgi:hypothetical protein
MTPYAQKVIDSLARWDFRILSLRALTNATSNQIETFLQIRAKKHNTYKHQVIDDIKDKMKSGTITLDTIQKEILEYAQEQKQARINAMRANDPLFDFAIMIDEMEAMK